MPGIKVTDIAWGRLRSPDLDAQEDVVLTLVKDGDHRLSRPEDIERLLAAVSEF